MNRISSTTTVTEKLTDLELIFKLRADMSRFRKKKDESAKIQSNKAA